MKLDRSLFLALTCALAGVACEQNVPASGSKTPAAPTATSTSDSTSTMGTESTSSDADSGASAPDSAAAAAAPVDLPKIGRDDPECGDDTKFSATKTGCADEAPTTVGACSFTYPSNEMCKVDSTTAICSGFSVYLKPKPAAAAVACLHAKSKTWDATTSCMCDISSCVGTAVFAACPDATADAACKAIAATCSGVDMGKCSAYLSGLTPKGRDAMVACLKDSDSRGCDWGFQACLRALDWSSAPAN